VFAAFFINFENGEDSARVDDIQGISFETFNGYIPIYSDIRTGTYNVTSDDLDKSYLSGKYHMNGNYCIWAGPEADARGVKVDFTKNNGTYFRTGYSSDSSFYLDAYFTDGTSSSIKGSANTNNPMAYLEIKSPANKFIDYIVLHDTGNYWLVDDMSGDSSANKHNFWGIFIGNDFIFDTVNVDPVEDPEDIPYSNLDGAKIAKEIYDKFQIFPNNRRILITDDEKMITKDRISKAINDIKPRMESGDILLIYLVGHGGPKGSESGDETTKTPDDEFVYINDLGEKITDDDLKSMLEGIDNIDKWCIIDACHSGGFWGNNNSNDIGDLEKLSKMYRMSSAHEDDSMYYIGGYDHRNDVDLGKPLFSINLRSALALKSNKKAFCDMDDNGIITFDELKEWLSDKNNLTWINGKAVLEGDFGDKVLFSTDKWNPAFDKTNDFGGVLCTIDSNEPRANIVDNIQAYVGQPILFDASNSSSPYGGIIKYEWDWNGDGEYDEETINPTIEHTFSNIYEGIIVLKITDIENYNDTTSISINVLENQPTVAESDDNGGGGGGCFISASSPNGPAALEYLFFVIAGLLFIGIDHLRRKRLS